MAEENKPLKRDWFPDKEDKFLPLSIIAAMFLSVLILSLSMISTIKGVCEINPSPCYPAKSDAPPSINATKPNSELTAEQARKKEDAEKKVQAAQESAEKK